MPKYSLITLKLKTKVLKKNNQIKHILSQNGRWPADMHIMQERLLKWILQALKKPFSKLVRLWFEKYKATLEICVDIEDIGLNFTLLFIVNLTFIRLELAVAAQKQLEIHQVHNSSAFLQGTLKRGI